MRLFTCAIVALVVMAVPAAAQIPDPPFPVEGTVIKVSPVFGPREDPRAAVVLLEGGTMVRVLGREGFWFKVVFSTPQGEQEGLMEPTDVRIDPNATSLSGGRYAAVFSQRGAVEIRGFGFPEAAPNDTSRSLGDVLLRQEAFLKLARWVQFSLGVDLRATSQDEVEEEWRFDFEDRGVLRPRVAIRRLAMALTSRYVSLDLGKQFVRWGRTDILSPVDRFAPRDYVNLLDGEFLPVIGARTSVRAGGETFELVWVPQMTPSRLPLLGRRWTVVPPEAAGLILEDRGTVFPDKSEQGFRWSHAGRFEMGLSVFDGFNHLPDISATVDPGSGTVALTRSYSALRTYGGELSVPMPVFTLKGEAAWFTSPTSTSEEYVLYVIEAERQMGEWLLDAGYAGEVVTKTHELTSFPAERGVADSFIGRASFTIDPRRTVDIEGAARRNGRGLYAKGEFSQAFGRHWRLTLAAAGIAGEDDDFLGQYRRNSHVSATLRLSY